MKNETYKQYINRNKEALKQVHKKVKKVFPLYDKELINKICFLNFQYAKKGDKALIPLGHPKYSLAYILIKFAIDNKTITKEQIKDYGKQLSLMKVEALRIIFDNKFDCDINNINEWIYEKDTVKWYSETLDKKYTASQKYSNELFEEYKQLYNKEFSFKISFYSLQKKYPFLQNTTYESFHKCFSKRFNHK